MTVTLAVALLALLVALFALLALVAVYARVRGLEAVAVAGPSGYPTRVGRPAPVAVRPRSDERGALVAVVDGDCVLCRAVLAGLADFTTTPAGTGVRVVALTDRLPDPGDQPLPAGALHVDAAVRADLFEGYAPTVLAVDAAGTVVARRFVYPDTDVPALLLELARRTEMSHAMSERATDSSNTVPARSADRAQRGSAMSELASEPFNTALRAAPTERSEGVR